MFKTKKINFRNCYKNPKNIPNFQKSDDLSQSLRQKWTDLRNHFHVRPLDYLTVFVNGIWRVWALTIMIEYIKVEIMSVLRIFTAHVVRDFIIGMVTEQRMRI